MQIRTLWDAKVKAHLLTFYLHGGIAQDTRLTSMRYTVKKPKNWRQTSLSP
jgi:hypothetical protein